MKEIKFRIWDEQNECFFYWGFDVNKDFGGFAGIPNSSIMNTNFCRDNSEQYTGLKDFSDNKEAYEGDNINIIQDGREHKDLIIKWSEDCCGFIAENEDWKIRLYAVEHIEIIGNIHEENSDQKSNPTK